MNREDSDLLSKMVEDLDEVRALHSKCDCHFCITSHAVLMTDSYIERNSLSPEQFVFVSDSPRTGSTLKWKQHASTFAYEARDMNSNREWVVR